MRLSRLRSGVGALFRSVILDDRRGHRVAVVLLALTAASIASTGWLWHASASGLPLAAATLFILLAHEMGHLVACRIHGVDSTWPFLLPAPLLNPFVGTLGAVIAIRQPFPSRRALFDIGVAGPLAGLAACLVVLAIGAGTDTMATPPLPPGEVGEVIPVGLPLLWQPALAVFGAERGASLGPLGVAAWFGFLLTGLNLIPIGQLDGGHLLYALFPRHASRISRLAWLGGLVLAVWTPAWLFWGLLMGLIGRRGHPPTLDDTQAVGPLRGAVALLALAVFVLTFIPQPVIVTWDMLLRDLGLLS